MEKDRDIAARPRARFFNLPRGTARPLPTAFSAVKHRNFRLFIGGQMISVAGTWMQVIAQAWLVYELTHSEWMLGVVAFAAAIPALIITPFGGVVVDSAPKRWVLVATQTSAMLLALILAFLAFTGRVQVWHIIALAAGLGVVNAFDAPARQAFVVEMVGREDLPNAIALNSMVFNSGRVVGPAIGGLLLAVLGAAWCFLINGISFLAVIAGLLMMRLPPHRPRGASASPWQQLAEGVRYVLEKREFLALILIALIFSFFGMSYAAVLPAFTDVILHSGASGYAWINTLTGLGAVSGAFFLASRHQMQNRGRWLMWINLFFSAVLFTFALNHSMLLSLALAYGLGLGFMHRPVWTTRCVAGC